MVYVSFDITDIGKECYRKLSEDVDLMLGEITFRFASVLVLANGYPPLEQLDVCFRLNWTESVVGFVYEGGP